MALRRADRPEIVELTGQERVPVLVEGEEVVHDSKRILEYLDFAHPAPAQGGDDAGEPGPSGAPD